MSAITLEPESAAKEVKPAEKALCPLSILLAANCAAEATSGMGNHSLSLSAALQNRGHRVQILWNDLLGSKGKHGKWSRLSFPYALARWIRRSAQEGNYFDVVNVHEPSGMWCTLWRRWDASFPAVVVTSHGVEQRAWNLGAFRQMPSLKSRVIYPLTQLRQGNFALRHADAVAVLSSEDATFLHSTLGVARDRVHVLSNGVVASLFDVEWQPTERPRLLFLGTWIPRKGTELLTQVFHQLRARRPWLELCLAGTGVPSTEVLKDFPKEDRKAVTVLPKLKREEIPGILGRDQVFVLPSHFEGMPLSLLEAMAAGLPCVTSDICGMKDLLGRDGLGCLLPPGEVDPWMQTLGRLLDSPELRRSLGYSAKQIAKEKTWARVAEAWESVFVKATETPCSRFILRENCWSDQIRTAPQDRLVNDLLNLHKEVETLPEAHRAMEQWGKTGICGRILDLGCGTGWKARSLQAKGNSVVACDYDFRLLQHAGKGGANNLLQCDALRLPFAAEYFDWVVAIEVIEHLRMPEGFLDEIRRVLRPGGKLLLTTPNRLQYMRPWRPLMMLHATRRRIVIEPSHVREYTDREVTGMLGNRLRPISVRFRGTLTGFPKLIDIHVLPTFLQRVWAQGLEIIAEKPVKQ